MGGRDAPGSRGAKVAGARGWRGAKVAGCQGGGVREGVAGTRMT
jgi:hypothetical protein